MDKASNRFTVFPSYCTGDNTPSLETSEELRAFLVEEMNETHEPGDDCVADDTVLADLFAMGDEQGDFIRFDVTRPGCLQSTLAVFAGDVRDDEEQAPQV